MSLDNVLQSRIPARVIIILSHTPAGGVLKGSETLVLNPSLTSELSFNASDLRRAFPKGAQTPAKHA